MSKFGATTQSGAIVVWSTMVHVAPMPLGSAGWAAAMGFDELGKKACIASRKTRFTMTQNRLSILNNMLASKKSLYNVAQKMVSM